MLRVLTHEVWGEACGLRRLVMSLALTVQNLYRLRFWSYAPLDFSFRKVHAASNCAGDAIKEAGKQMPSILPVSYTHLTLPTNREV